MDIIIAGDGEVGFYLAEALSDSKHNITIVDPHEELLKMVEAHTDLMTIVGESNSVSVLKQANVEKADLVISVLHNESINILTAILAKKMGAKSTIARVNTLENVSKESRKLYEELGIDILISPEDIAGLEVIKLLAQPAATEIYDLSDGQLSVFLIRIEAGAPAIGKTLNEIAAENGSLDFRAVAVHRGLETFLPTGNTSFRENDMVYVITKPEAMDELMEMGGKKKMEIDNIMVVGGGRVGKVISKRLEKDLNIKLIEQNADRCMNLIDLLDDTLVINGDARDINLLEDEGIDGVDAFIAVTNSPETNILTCLHAKKFGVKKTIALVENIDYIEISQNIGIDTVINKKLIAASYIIKHSMGDEVSSFKCLSGINSDIVELVAKKGSPITKKPIHELKMPEGSIIGGIVRGDKSFIALGKHQVEAGDKVVVFALPGSTPKLEKMFMKSLFA
ncbi:MAG: Trk system potassium transporter TrkA [Bacteroidales bacterium]|nr:Trk system potassium transporter TrkA [Bacteroidales bacterium]MCF6342964.1 Trk system potassium transporter TrkA [Bacteroidales bacterium]